MTDTTEAPTAPAIPDATAVLSRAQAETFTPAGSPRSYTLHPLTRRERNLFRRDMVAAGAQNPGQWQLFDAMRAGLRELAPDNLEELLAVVAEAEGVPSADPLPDDLRARLAPIEAIALDSFPAYAALVAAREFWWSTLPTIILRRALRGWSGPGLPPFRRRGEVVPDDLLEAIPDAEIGFLGGRAFALAFLGGAPAAEKN